MSTPIKLIFLQLALIEINRAYEPLEEYLSINTLLGNIINKTPIVLPTFQDRMPAEIPIVQASDTDNTVNINVGRKRVDFLVTVNDKPSADRFITGAKKLLDKYRSPGFGRMGLIAQYIIETPDAAQWLHAKFLSDHVRNPSDILIRFNRKSLHQGWQINHMYQFQEIVIQEADRQTRKVHLQLDINTPMVSTPNELGQFSESILRSKMGMLRGSDLKEVMP